MVTFFFLNKSLALQTQDAPLLIVIAGNALFQYLGFIFKTQVSNVVDKILPSCSDSSFQELKARPCIISFKSGNETNSPLA